MGKKEMLYEGKAKRVYATDVADEVFIEYKDDATAFNGGKKGSIDSKGIMNNEITSILFEMLEKAGVPTHFVKKVDDRGQICKKVEIVPLEVIVRNVGAGSFCQRYGVEEGTKLKNPVYELCYKKDELGDPFICDSAVMALGFAEKEEVETIYALAAKVNTVLQAFFLRVGILLIDFKLEFGRYNGAIVLADEISPDTCRFWDKDTNKKLDKDRFRRDLGDVKEAYIEVLSRLKGE